jgi:hypothetical protein
MTERSKLVMGKVLEHAYDKTEFVNGKLQLHEACETRNMISHFLPFLSTNCCCTLSFGLYPPSTKKLGKTNFAFFTRGLL